MKNIISLVLIFNIFIGIFGCSLKKPTDIEGRNNIVVFVVDTTGTVLPNPTSGFSFVNGANVQLYSQEYDIAYATVTDSTGKAEIENILASKYIISVRKKIPGDLLPDSVPTNKDMLLNGIYEKTVYKNQVLDSDTIRVGRKLLSRIVINEVYYCGSTSNNGIYQYDQFVELYNASDSVQYLDGLIIANPTLDNSMLDQYAKAMYLYQFPGKGKDFPLASGDYTVVAQDAIDHIVKSGAVNSIDLSDAKWEFYNKYGDLDNPLVSNLENINPNHKNDFMLNLKYGGILLVNGKNIDQLNFTQSGHVLFNYNDVMDAVAYSRDLGTPKLFGNIIETGFAGNGIQKYSGKSVERVNPIDGTAGYDTDNSSLDFKVIESPTPGYQHDSENVGPCGNL